MSRFTSALLACLAVSGVAQAGTYPGVGRPATPAEVKAWDIDVRPDFKGLPSGSGSVEKGQQVWESKCASCHGTFGESNEVFTPLVGGTNARDMQSGRVASLLDRETVRTTFMKLSTLSTLWDYVNRAMPWNAPKSLSTDEVYAVVAYMLNLADIVPGDFVLSELTMAQVQAKLPNRNGMTREHGLWDIRGKPDVKNVACMKDCPTEAKIASSLPEFARDSHGNIADQNREVGPGRGGSPSPEPQAAAKAAPAGMAELARTKACLACHAVDKRLVGPAFAEVAQRYKGQAGAEEALVQKVRKGGSGTWGAMAMPPQPDLAEADIRALVRWVLGGAK